MNKIFIGKTGDDIMNEILKEKCDLLVANRNAIKESFKFEYNVSCAVASLLCCAKDRKADIDKIKECKKIIKKKTSMLSNFRGNIFFTTAAVLSLSDNPEKLMDDINDVYKMLKDKGFDGSEFLGLAAIIIAQRLDQYEPERVAGKAFKIYKSIKLKHKFLTGSDDYAFTVMLAMNEKTVEEIVEETERCYLELKKDLSSGNAVQSLSHVLAMDERSYEEKCQRVTIIYNKLRDRGYKFGKGSELVTLGVLEMIDCDIDELVDNIAETDIYLKSFSGFGMSIGKQQRLMYASTLAAYVFIDSVKNIESDVVISNSMINVLMTAQMAAISAGAAAAAASASSAN